MHEKSNQLNKMRQCKGHNSSNKSWFDSKHDNHSEVQVLEGAGVCADMHEEREREREDVCARVEKERVFRDLHQGGDGAAPCRGSRQDE